ncbi:diphosphomevalonate decarboxylase [Candidatus Gottesmanbacteria bacterium]|nr:diphosphomevalonate decarboxylase [Candidatus Gottesmanbacteria bacterium]
MKSTAIAPSNIAFIKYWGKKDEVLRLPENGSISMNLSNLLTTTTVEFNSSARKDSVTINGVQEPNDGNRAIKHLDRVRNLANLSQKAKVVTINNFPSGTGLSSSSSGFAALSLAGAKAAGLSLSEKELSILARQGSGSACRSIPDGFVEWLDGVTSETSYSRSLYPPDYWSIADVVAIVSVGKKDVSSAEGQKLVNSSPFFPVRRSHMPQKINKMKEILKEKNFQTFGELLEAEALELHAIMITSIPSLIYWTPGTLKIMKLVKKWRSEGLSVYFTINTGQDIHLICEKPNIKNIVTKLKEIEEVKNIIINYPSIGARLTQNHLF